MAQHILQEQQQPSSLEEQLNEVAGLLAQQIEQLQAGIQQTKLEIAQSQGRDLNLLGSIADIWLQKILKRYVDDVLGERQ